MPSLSTARFLHNGSRHALIGGERFSAPRAAGFRDTPTSELESLLSSIRSGQPWRSVVDARFSATKPWLHSIITSPARTAFFESVLPSGDGLVLDLGSGWGQIARPLAHQRPVVALEPVAERLNFIEESARQEGVHQQITYLEADYLELELETRFTAICAIGVLEWVGAFQTHSDPQDRQRRFLQKVRSELTAGGHLILGIENRIGLKYLLGCPDDHLGVPGIACLPAPLAKARWLTHAGHALQSFTYSPAELSEMLCTAGFGKIEFFGAFPDYKLPQVIRPFGENGQELNTWLANGGAVPAEHNGYDGSPLSPEFNESLAAHYRTLAQEHTAHTFVPSFFVRAS
ncbi:MAG: class I SAM-dependent methyltransferase [Opitutus sp.]